MNIDWDIFISPLKQIIKSNLFRWYCFTKSITLKINNTKIQIWYWNMSGVIKIVPGLFSQFYYFPIKEEKTIEDTWLTTWYNYLMNSKLFEINLNSKLFDKKCSREISCKQIKNYPRTVMKTILRVIKI